MNYTELPKFPYPFDEKKANEFADSVKNFKHDIALITGISWGDGRCSVDDYIRFTIRNIFRSTTHLEQLGASFQWGVKRGYFPNDSNSIAMLCEMIRELGSGFEIIIDYLRQLDCHQWKNLASALLVSAIHELNEKKVTYLLKQEIDMDWSATNDKGKTLLAWLFEHDCEDKKKKSMLYALAKHLDKGEDSSLMCSFVDVLASVPLTLKDQMHYLAAYTNLTLSIPQKAWLCWDQSRQLFVWMKVCLSNRKQLIEAMFTALWVKENWTAESCTCQTSGEVNTVLSYICSYGSQQAWELLVKQLPPVTLSDYLMAHYQRPFYRFLFQEKPDDWQFKFVTWLNSFDEIMFDTEEGVKCSLDALVFLAHSPVDNGLIIRSARLLILKGLNVFSNSHEPMIWWSLIDNLGQNKPGLKNELMNLFFSSLQCLPPLQSYVKPSLSMKEVKSTFSTPSLLTLCETRQGECRQRPLDNWLEKLLSQWFNTEGKTEDELAYERVSLCYKQRINLMYYPLLLDMKENGIKGLLIVFAVLKTFSKGDRALFETSVLNLMEGRQYYIGFWKIVLPLIKSYKKSPHIGSTGIDTRWHRLWSDWCRSIGSIESNLVTDSAETELYRRLIHYYLTGLILPRSCEGGAVVYDFTGLDSVPLYYEQVCMTINYSDQLKKTTKQPGLPNIQKKNTIREKTRKLFNHLLSMAKHCINDNSSQSTKLDKLAVLKTMVEVLTTHNECLTVMNEPLNECLNELMMEPSLKNMLSESERNKLESFKAKHVGKTGCNQQEKSTSDHKSIEQLVDWIDEDKPVDASADLRGTKPKSKSKANRPKKTEKNKTSGQNNSSSEDVLVADLISTNDGVNGLLSSSNTNQPWKLYEVVSDVDEDSTVSGKFEDGVVEATSLSSNNVIDVSKEDSSLPESTSSMGVVTVIGRSVEDSRSIGTQTCTVTDSATQTETRDSLGLEVMAPEKNTEFASGEQCNAIMDSGLSETSTVSISLFRLDKSDLEWRESSNARKKNKYNRNNHSSANQCQQKELAPTMQALCHNPYYSPWIVSWMNRYHLSSVSLDSDFISAVDTYLKNNTSMSDADKLLFILHVLQTSVLYDELVIDPASLAALGVEGNWSKPQDLTGDSQSKEQWLDHYKKDLLFFPSLSLDQGQVQFKTDVEYSQMSDLASEQIMAINDDALWVYSMYYEVDKTRSGTPLASLLEPRSSSIA